MKKKKVIISILIFIFIFIILIVICRIFLKIYITSVEEQKIEKGYLVLGDDYCEGHSLWGLAGDMVTSWTCKICGFSADNPDTEVPTICNECAEITERCVECGKLKSDKQIEE